MTKETARAYGRLIVTEAEIETAAVNRAMLAYRGARQYLTYSDLYAMAENYGGNDLPYHITNAITAHPVNADAALRDVRIRARIAFSAARRALDAHANAIASR